MEPELFTDERGFFTHTWSREEFLKHGITETPLQSNVSLSKEAGTIRGMHYQLPPHQEGKLVRCTAGAIFDVVLDLREGSPTFLKWFGRELSAENHLSMWVPPGCAHGLQTLLPVTEITYLVTAPYSKELERGVRWNDPAVGIAWPLAVTRMSDRDRVFPLLRGGS